jgi:type IV secretion system protein TrbL
MRALSRSSRRALAFALLLVGVALIVPDVFAQDQTQIRYTGILDSFRDQSIRWQGGLLLAARWLFFTLAIIQFAWTNMELALKGGDASDFIATNTRSVLSIGVMYVFLVHAFQWSTALVMGFRQAGERAVIASAGAGAESAIDPAGIFQNGLIVAGSLFSQVSVWSGADNVALVICALVLLVCFALLSAYMAVAIVESYIVIGGSVLLLGFGGSSFTGDIAKKTLMYAVSVGAKLFVMQLVVGVAMGSVITWAQTYESDNSTSTLSLVGLVLLVTVCAKMIPDLVQGILSGASVGGTGSLVATVAASVAAAGAGAAALRSGGGAAAGAAGGAASSGGAGAAAAATSGAAGAASHGTSAAAMAFSPAAGHLAKMGGHIIDAGSGLNPNQAFGPLQSSGRTPSEPSAGAKPELPGQGGSDSSYSSSLGGSGNTSSGAGDGGTIRGAGAPPSSSNPAASMSSATSNAGSSSSSAGTGASKDSQPASGTVSRDAAAPTSSPSVQSGGGGSPQTLDDRSSDGSSSGTGAGDSHLAASQLSEQPELTGSEDRPSTIGGETQTLDERSGSGSTGSDAASRLRNATRGAVAGFAVAGPGGAAIGASLGAGFSPQIDGVGKRAAARLAAARQRFGLL